MSEGSSTFLFTEGLGIWRQALTSRGIVIPYYETEQEFFLEREQLDTGANY